MDGLFVTVGELSEYLNCRVIGDRQKKIYGIALMNDSNEDMLTYVSKDKIGCINNIKAGVILVKATIGLPFDRTYIVAVSEPYEILAKTINFLISKGLYCVENDNKPLIAESAKISDGAVIENGAVIGDNCFIGANTVIGQNTVIESNVRIGSCCSIGTENFEYCKKKQGWSKIPVVGGVHICSNVIIGGNVVVERGTIGTTVIGANTQIENLVQVGHECRIGENCHIVACTALAGWCEIGNNVDIYGQCAVSNNIKIGDNAILLAKSGVDKNIKENTVVWGTPAQEYRKEMRFQAFLRKLFEKSIKKDVK